MQHLIKLPWRPYPPLVWVSHLPRLPGPHDAMTYHGIPILEARTESRRFLKWGPIGFGAIFGAGLGFVALSAAVAWLAQ